MLEPSVDTTGRTHGDEVLGRQLLAACVLAGVLGIPLGKTSLDGILWAAACFALGAFCYWKPQLFRDDPRGRNDRARARAAAFARNRPPTAQELEELTCQGCRHRFQRREAGSGYAGSMSDYCRTCPRCGDWVEDD